VDEVWEDAASAAGVYQNVHRWYAPSIARYSRPDPLGILPPERSAFNLFEYALSNPLYYRDRLGLDAATSDKGVRQCIYCIFQRGGYGNRNSEEALWLTCDDDGKFGCQVWPSTARQGNSNRSTTSTSGVPSDACGLVHTHPRRKPATPSTCQGCDVDVSDRLGMPVYTVHPGGIWKYDPTTKQTTLEKPGGWAKEFKKTCGKKPCKGLL